MEIFNLAVAILLLTIAFKTGPSFETTLQKRIIQYIMAFIYTLLAAGNLNVYIQSLI